MVVAQHGYQIFILVRIGSKSHPEGTGFRILKKEVAK